MVMLTYSWNRVCNFLKLVSIVATRGQPREKIENILIFCFPRPCVKCEPSLCVILGTGTLKKRWLSSHLTNQISACVFWRIPHENTCGNIRGKSTRLFYSRYYKIISFEKIPKMTSSKIIFFWCDVIFFWTLLHFTSIFLFFLRVVYSGGNTFVSFKRTNVQLS